MRISILLCVLLIAGFSVSAQEPTITLVDQQFMESFFGEFSRDVSLSPDGTLLAIDKIDEICFTEIVTHTSTCHPKPEGIGGISGSPFHNPFAWSFDSRLVTFTANFYMHLREPDIWTLDLQTGEYINHTDDGVEEVLGEEGDGALLDYLPIFAPNGDLYFFRSMRVDGGYLTNVYRLAVGSDTPEFVADLTANMSSLSIYYSPRISPDGTKLVYPVMGARSDDAQNGLWVLDLESGEATQIATLEDANIGMPPHNVRTPYIFENPVWTPDSQAILVSVAATDFTPSRPQQNYLYIDADGAITPLVDLTDSPTGSQLFATDEEGNTPMLNLPRLGAMLPDGSGFIYLRYIRSASEAQLVWLTLPPDGSEPRIIAEIEFESLSYVSNMLMGGQNALLMNVLYTFEIAE